MVWNYLLAFLAAAGVLLIFWCFLGILLVPRCGRDTLTLCFLRGDGEEMEQQVRAYGRLREGSFSGGRLVLVDCGLSGDALDRAQILRERYSWVDYCPHPALIDYIDLEMRED